MNNPTYRVYLDEQTESPAFTVKQLLEKFSSGEIDNDAYVRPDVSGSQYIPLGQLLAQKQHAAKQAIQSTPAGPQKVTVVNFDMPFGAMVNFMVKWALASIPAFVILFIFFFVVGFFLMVVGVGSLGSLGSHR